MDPTEEQVAELEALEAIFATDFRIVQEQSSKEDARFEIDLVDDVTESVRFRLIVTHTKNYPQEPPGLVVHTLEGMSTSRRKELQSHLEYVAKGHAEDHMPSAFSLCEAAKEWVTAHVVGHTEDEDNGHESDSKFETLDATQEDKVEFISSKAMGTPVTVESFMAWREKFLEELEKVKSVRQIQKETNTKLTGREFFESKTLVVTAESESFWENEASLYDEADI
ncbi:RWD domain-containing protein 1 [Gracilariopsis chorda]|uniref:RWD domain-containing protein 1 n=1 Tax=Gracilariopsis chorda TaxID=448386 RepID=A0A2V3J1E0_9FLOR|nr:RWD domain-containing protein 1 [Gracilariopsis chorda]|eukprot:PXF48198.1 RWD domain-containing protein 1 [Gracilariopsis chorda]